MKVVPAHRQEFLEVEEAHNLFARWRALKRLAIEACDTDRELEFNAQEICAERAASRWPMPIREQGWKVGCGFFSAGYTASSRIMGAR